MSNANKALALAESYRRGMEQRTDKLAKLLENQIGVEKFKEISLTAILNLPNIQNCDAKSVFKAIAKSAELSLLPDGRKAALVVRRSKHGQDTVTLQPMVAGIIEILNRSGQIKTLVSNVVYQGEAFEYWIDEDGDRIKHVPKMDGSVDRTQKKATHVYCIIRTLKGGKFIEVLTREQVMAAKSVAKTAMVWDGKFWESMWKKTAIHKISKKIDLSPQAESMVRQIEDESELESVETTGSVVPEQVAPPTFSKRLENLVENEKKAEKTPENDRKPL